MSVLRAESGLTNAIKVPRNDAEQLNHAARTGEQYIDKSLIARIVW